MKSAPVARPIVLTPSSGAEDDGVACVVLLTFEKPHWAHRSLTAGSRVFRSHAAIVSDRFWN